MGKQIKSKLVIVTGRPGSGKTTIAKELGRLLYLPVLCRDEIKEGYVNTFGIHHSELPPGANKNASEAFFKTLHLLLSSGVSVIAEAAFQHAIWKEELGKLNSICNPVLVVCEVKPELAAKRHLERGLEDEKRTYFHEDNRVVHFKQTGEVLPPGEYETPNLDVRTIVVNTANDYAPSLDEVGQFVKM